MIEILAVFGTMIACVGYAYLWLMFAIDKIHWKKKK